MKVASLSTQGPAKEGMVPSLFCLLCGFLVLDTEPVWAAVNPHICGKHFGGPESPVHSVLRTEGPALLRTCQPGLRMGSNHHSEQMLLGPSSAMDLVHSLPSKRPPVAPNALHVPVALSATSPPSVLFPTGLSLVRSSWDLQQDPPWQGHRWLLQA